VSAITWRSQHSRRVQTADYTIQTDAGQPVSLDGLSAAEMPLQSQV
jgi:hypothetical protein